MMRFNPQAINTGRSLLRNATLLTMVLLLGACATGIPPRNAVVSLPVAYEGAQGSTDAVTLDQWWLLFQDAQLTPLVNQALAQGFGVREAQARMAESRALRSAALSGYALQGNVQGNVTSQDTRALDDRTASASAAGTNNSAGINLPMSWELDVFGRRDAATISADADLDSARLDVQAARAAIAAEVARGLFQARGFAVQQADGLETLRIQKELLKVVQERARRGLAPSSEADRVAADVAQAEAQTIELGAALNASRRALLVVLGNGTAGLDQVLVASAVGDAPLVPNTLPGDLLERRPDVLKATVRVRKSAGAVRLAELSFFPQFTLNPGLGLSAQRSATDTTLGFWSLGVGLTLPVLDRPRLQAQLNAEGARAEQAVLAYERTVQTAFSEADQALTRLQADRRRVNTLKAGELRARSAFEAAQKRYELGFANLQELLDGERAWRATRSALTGAKVDELQRSVQAFQALGGGWTVAALASQQEGITPCTRESGHCR